jgi:peptide-methionine (S)-S-oxide reductase
METAIFGAGCFWGIEDAFGKVNGVVGTEVGYSGGTKKDPTYRDVCSGTTGHAEVVKVTYDPDRVSYDELLDVFWEIHDPTTHDRQGPDVGEQYRSVIFFTNPAQEAAALASKEKLGRSGRYKKPIVTQIEPAPAFYRAEEYHQKYHAKHGGTCCDV